MGLLLPQAVARSLIGGNLCAHRVFRELEKCARVMGSLLLLLQPVAVSLLCGNLCTRRVFCELGHDLDASRRRSEQDHEAGGEETQKMNTTGFG